MARARRALLHLAARLLHGAGLPAAIAHRRHRRGDFRFYILEYHDVVEGPQEPEGSVAAHRFRQHVHYLNRHFRCVTVAEGARQLAAGPLEQDLLAFTFDDGYVGNYRWAWPVLQQEKATATIYLVSGFLDGTPLWFDVARRSFSALRQEGAEGLSEEAYSILGRVFGLPSGQEPTLANIIRIPNPVTRLKYASLEDRHQTLQFLAKANLSLAPAARPMSWAQVKEMQAGGIEMGAHTITHPILAKLTLEQQEEELQRSRQRITEATSIRPQTAAFPNGSIHDFNSDTLEVVHKLNFQAACTTIRGSNRPIDDLRTLKRIGVGADSIPLLALRLTGLLDEGMRRWLRR